MGLLNFLPDDPNEKAAMRQGLLSFGAAMLQGHGNFGNMAGQGLAAASQGYQGSIQQQQKDQLEAAQLRLLQNKDGREQNRNSILNAAFGTAPVPNATAEPPGPRTREQNAAAAQPTWQPYSGAEAQGAALAAERSGADYTDPATLNRLMAQTRQGRSASPSASVVAPLESLPTKQGGTGKFPFSLQQITALKATGGPDLSSEYKMANEGFKREQGSTYDMPDGTSRSYAKLDNGQSQGPDGSVTTAPGYIDALSAAERAKADAQERAKAANEILDPTKFIGADGRPIADTRAGYISKIKDLPRVGQPAPVRAPVRQAGPAGFPVVTPQQQQARDGDRMAILQAERARITDPKDLASIDREIAGTRAPVLQSAAEAKGQLGAVDTQLKAGQGLNENWIKEVHNPVQAEGRAARTTLTQLETVKNVNFATGWGSEAKAGAADILASLGVRDATKYASKAQTFQQVAMERNMTMLQSQSGPQTEGDSQRAQQTFLKLSNTPLANQFIADLTGANARVAAKKAAFYNEALPLAKASGDLTEIDRRWSRIAPSVWADPALSRYKGK